MRSILKIALLGFGLLASAVACTNAQTLPVDATATSTIKATSTPSIIESGLLYGDTCKPPCWHGIVPGKSTGQAASEAIKKLGYSGDVGDAINGYWLQPYSLPTNGVIDYVSIPVKNGIAQKIDGSTDNFKLTMRDIVKLVGEPEGIYPVGGGSPASNISCNGWQPPQKLIVDIPVHVLYPQQGLYFFMLEPIGAQSQSGLICPDMEVKAFCFFAPLPMDQALKDNFLANLCAAEGLKGVTIKGVIKWHGFSSGY